MTTTWEQRAATKRAAQANLIPSSLRLNVPSPSNGGPLDVRNCSDVLNALSEREKMITEVESVGRLLDHLATGEWTAVETLQAFSKRALLAHQLVNCLTEIFIEQGLERAKELDEHLKSTGKPIGPLHGLPISLKDQVDIAGQDMTMGYVGWIGNVSDRNAVMADLLLQQGAVLYVRTNVPQSLMLGEAINNVFGTTSNPANRNLSSGGSSGGEGALIAMRGSVLGVGTDIGGSIRIPSTFNGLYGLRGSYNRFPYAGTTNSMEGQEAVFSVIGPLSASIDGLGIFARAILAAKPWTRDPLCLRMPFNESEYELENHGGPGAQLCFAMLWDDGYCKPDPPYRRALETTKRALEAAGHKVVDWVPYETAEGWKILGGIYNADGGHDIDEACALSGEPRVVSVLAGTEHLRTWDYWQLCRAKQDYTRRHLEHWEATRSQTGTGRPVDAIIAPGSATAPPPHTQSKYVYYTGWCNLTDQVAAVVPVTHVDPELDVKPPPHEFRSDDDRAVYEMYDPEFCKGGPIGIQVVGRKNEEEALIRLAEIVDAAIKRSTSSSA